MKNLGQISEEAINEYARLVAEDMGMDFSEGETYDFARCMRPDGTYYGTSGKCRKGTEAGAKEQETGGGYKAPSYNPNPEGAAKMARALARKKGDEAAAKAADAELKRIRKDKRELPARAKAEMDKRREAAAKPASKPRATTAETKPKWQEAENAVKAAKAELKKVAAETKGDKSPEARKRRLEAGRALDRAERAAQKAYDRFSAAAKRESYKAMTPEQRKEEREWRQTQKRLG